MIIYEFRRNLKESDEAKVNTRLSFITQLPMAFFQSELYCFSQVT